MMMYLLQRILDWLDLEHEEYLDALWRFGGDMTHAVQWILCGRTEQGNIHKKDHTSTHDYFFMSARLYWILVQCLTAINSNPLNTLVSCKHK